MNWAARLVRAMESGIVFLSVLVERVRLGKTRMMFQAARWAAEDWMNRRY